VAHTPYLGMEHQSIIAYGAGFQHGSLFGQFAPFDDLHQHELAHEWWGNMITAWDWRDFWIHEGFGTYMQALYAEYLEGEEAYHNLIGYFRQLILSDKEIAPTAYQSTVDVYGGGRGGDIYYKGAVVLHTLRYLLGDDLFFKSLRRFLYPDPELKNAVDGSHVRFVTTDDYLEIVNNLTGDDYSWFFEIYLRETKIPVLQKIKQENSMLLKWKFTTERYFPMPVEIEVNGNKMRFNGDDEKMNIEFQNEDDLIVDPDHWILMEVLDQ